MPINRPPTESQPRPQKAVDVLCATDSESESGLMFDPKVDISHECQDKFFKLYRNRNGRDEDLPASATVPLSILFPDRKHELWLDDQEFNETKKLFDQWRREKSWFGFCGKAKILSILFPDRRDELRLDDELFYALKTKLDECRQDDLEVAGNMAVDLCILYPDRKAEIGLGEIDFNRMKSKLDEYRRNNNWWHFSFMAANLSILYPDRKDELGLSCSETTEIKNVLDGCLHRGFWGGAIDLAFCLMILSADRVEIDSSSQFRFTYKPKTLVKPRRPLPERSRV